MARSKGEGHMRPGIAAAVLAAWALQLAPAFGQQPGAVVPVDPAVTDSTGAVDPASIIESIRAGRTNIGAIQSMSSVGSVEVIRIGASAPDMEGELESAIEESRADIAMLQEVVAANPALKAELDAQSIPVTDVVAARVEADGSLKIFVK
jgi:hypothetical protein